MASISQQARKIHDIIASELVVRQNNVNFTQEYGEAGASANIVVDQSTGTLIFSTGRIIHEILFVTYNGLSLAEGVHYSVDRPNTVTIPTISGTDPNTAIVLIGYHYTVGAVSVVNTAVPVIKTFYTTPNSGEEQDIILEFAIQANAGENISWSINKNGLTSTPLYTGTGLETANGYVVGPDGSTLIYLKYEVTAADVALGVPQITFTLAVDYEMPGGARGGVVFANTDYEITSGVPAPLTGGITSSPGSVALVGDTDVDINANLENPEGDVFSWTLYKTLTGTLITQGVRIVLQSGSSSDVHFTLAYTDTITADATADYTISYFIESKKDTRNHLYSCWNKRYSCRHSYGRCGNRCCNSKQS